MIGLYGCFGGAEIISNTIAAVFQVKPYIRLQEVKQRRRDEETVAVRGGFPLQRVHPAFIPAGDIDGVSGRGDGQQVGDDAAKILPGRQADVTWKRGLLHGVGRQCGLGDPFGVVQHPGPFNGVDQLVAKAAYFRFRFIIRCIEPGACGVESRCE